MQQHLHDEWQSMFNMDSWSHADVAQDMKQELDHVRQDSKCQVPDRLKESLRPDALFHLDNIRKAVNRLKRGSSPGIVPLTESRQTSYPRVQRPPLH